MLFADLLSRYVEWGCVLNCFMSIHWTGLLDTQNAVKMPFPAFFSVVDVQCISLLNLLP